MSITTMAGRMRFALTAGDYLEVGEDVCAKVLKFRQLDPGALEAGGILLGRRFEEHERVIVDDVTLPQAADRRGRRYIMRSATHSELALQRWRASGQTTLFLGLWHTHPEPDPQPSSEDIRDWRRVLRRGRFEGEELFFLIVGTEHVRCWLGRRRKSVWRAESFTRLECVR